MRVLLDECVPRRLAREFAGHEVATVPAMGWAGTANGVLLRLAETQFDVFITVDQNVEYQQRLQSMLLGIVVLVAPNTRLDTLRPLMPRVLVVLQTIKPGDVVRVVA
jgi:hypothetical protein